MSIELDLPLLIRPGDTQPGRAPLAGVLFAEDFDLPDPPAAVAQPEAPPPPAPAFCQQDLDEACAAARLEGHRAALEQAAAQNGHAITHAALALSRALDDARTRAAEISSLAAERSGRLILEVLAAALPELCTRHGPDEAAHLTGTLLPMLRHEPRITIRANPHTLPGLRRIAEARSDVGQHGPELLLVPTDALAEGDVSVEWQDGAAVRDTRPLRRQIAALADRAAPARDTPAPDAVQHQDFADAR